MTKCESFDVQNNKWKTIGDLKDPRLNPGIMKTEQNLYVFGGANSIISLSHKNYKGTIEKLNLNGSSSFETIIIDTSKLDLIWQNSLKNIYFLTYQIKPNEILIFNNESTQGLTFDEV